MGLWPYQATFWVLLWLLLEIFMYSAYSWNEETVGNCGPQSLVNIWCGGMAQRARIRVVFEAHRPWPQGIMIFQSFLAWLIVTFHYDPSLMASQISNNLLLFAIATSCTVNMPKCSRFINIGSSWTWWSDINCDLIPNFAKSVCGKANVKYFKDWWANIVNAYGKRPPYTTSSTYVSRRY